MLRVAPAVIRSFEAGRASRHHQVVRISAGPTLTGTHVTLRSMHEGDAHDLRRLHAAPEIAEWWGPLEDDFPLSDDPEVTRMSSSSTGASPG